MSTPAQIAANQANSKLSTGPTSDAGREIVARNSTKHNLTGKGDPALPGEKEAVAEFVEGYMPGMHYSLALRKNDALGRRCHAVRGVACPGGDTALG